MENDNIIPGIEPEQNDPVAPEVAEVPEVAEAIEPAADETVEPVAEEAETVASEAEVVPAEETTAEESAVEEAPIEEISAEEVTAEEAPVETTEFHTSEFQVEAPKKKKFFKRWWFWLIVIVIGAFVFIAGSGSSDSSSSSSDSYYVPTISPYVSMVKDATNSNYGITYGKAFNYFFSNPDWSSFTATTGEIVVEFEGKFTYDNSPATAKIQFVLDLAGGTFSAYHLSINGVAQNKLMLATLINKVFETAYQHYYY